MISGEETGVRPGHLAEFSRGARAALPILLGYVPVALAFGALARQIDLSLWQIGLMSLFVYAGSSQFIAVSLLGAGASTATIIASTFLINLRHLLMSSALSPFLQRCSPRFLALMGAGLTDETFAVNYARLRRGNVPPVDLVAVNIVSQASWVIGSILGGVLGAFIPPGSFGIDFALPAMFICLIFMQLRHRLDVLIALFAGLCGLGIRLLDPGNPYAALIAAIAAATLGVLLTREK